MAAKDDAVRGALRRAARPRAELAGELADLLYHALVLCAERGLRADRGHGHAAEPPRR